MRRSVFLASAVLAAASALWGCSSLPGMRGGWTTLIDGDRGLDNFERVGDANWRPEGGAIVADSGKGGFLVSRQSWRDFEMRAEFWAETSTNSGVFIRATNPARIESASS